MNEPLPDGYVCGFILATESLCMAYNRYTGQTTFPKQDILDHMKKSVECEIMRVKVLDVPEEERRLLVESCREEERSDTSSDAWTVKVFYVPKRLAEAFKAKCQSNGQTPSENLNGYLKTRLGLEKSLPQHP